MAAMQDIRQGGISGGKRTKSAVFTAFFCMGLIFATWASRIPDIKTLLGLNDAQLGTLLVALPIGQLITMPLSGWLVSRFGSHRIAVIGQIGYALSLTGLGLVDNRTSLTIGLLAAGSLGNLSSISVNTQGVLTEKLHGRPMMATFHGAWSLAGLTGALLGLLAMNLGLSRSLHCTGVSVMVIAAALWGRGHLVGGAKGEVAKKSFRLPDRSVFPLAFIGFCTMATEGSMFDWSGVYFREVIRVPESLTLLGYAAFMLCMSGGRFVGDRVLSRWGKPVVLGASGILMSLGLNLAVLYPHIALTTVAFMIVGFAVSTVVPTVYSLAAQRSEVDPGIVIASVSSMSYLGFLLGPPAIGAIASATSLRCSYAVIAVLGLLIAGTVRRYLWWAER